MHLRLDVTVEDSIAVHVFDGFQQLVDVVFDSGLGQVVLATFDGFVQVHVHYLEDECETTGRLIIQDLDELDDVAVRGQSLQSFNLS